MITGRVTADLEPILYLDVVGDGTVTFTEPFVVDTGFSDYLSLPTDVITALALPFVDYGTLTLADKSVVPARVYQATVFWDGLTRLVDIYEMPRPSLVGMAMMNSHKLTVEARNGGAVLIEANP